MPLCTERLVNLDSSSLCCSWLSERRRAQLPLPLRKCTAPASGSSCAAELQKQDSRPVHRASRVRAMTAQAAAVSKTHSLTVHTLPCSLSVPGPVHDAMTTVCAQACTRQHSTGPANSGRCRRGPVVSLASCLWPPWPVRQTPQAVPARSGAKSFAAACTGRPPSRPRAASPPPPSLPTICFWRASAE